VQQFVKKTYPTLSSAKTYVRNFSNSTVASDGYSVGRSMNINRPISC
jgi:hypothetical protein